MKHAYLAALALVISAAPAVLAQPSRAIPADARITPAGLGPVRIGMAEAEVTRILGVPLEGEELTEGCRETVAAGLDGVTFMFEQGRLTRISVYGSSRLTTPRGIGIGASEAQVRAAYGRGLVSETHEYLGEPAKYLTFWLRPEASGVQFVTDERRRVDTIHAGTASIRYIEGCL
jgi:hypothetical protein